MGKFRFARVAAVRLRQHSKAERINDTAKLHELASFAELDIKIKMANQSTKRAVLPSLHGYDEEHKSSIADRRAVRQAILREHWVI